MTVRLITMTAAVIAALCSVLSLLISLIYIRRCEMRQARRAALEPIIDDLGGTVYSLIAVSKRMGFSRGSERYRENKAKAMETARALDHLRWQSRYALWGLNDGLHHLILLPKWIEHLRGRDESCARLIDLATELRQAVDDEVRRCWLQGAAPSRRSIRRIDRAAGRMKTFYLESKVPPAGPPA